MPRALRPGDWAILLACPTPPGLWATPKRCRILSCGEGLFGAPMYEVAYSGSPIPQLTCHWVDAERVVPITWQGFAGLEVRLCR